MDAQCPGLKLDHPVSRGYKYGGLIHQSVVRHEADFLTLQNNSCQETPEMQTGCNENRRKKAANRMEWQRNIGMVKAGTRLLHQYDNVK
jgi:hypothetical protein